MAKGNGIRLEGIKEFIKVLDSLDADLKRKGDTAALRKAAKPIQSKAKGYLKSWMRGSDRDGFSKLRLLAETVRIVNHKGSVNVQIKNIVDIPVKGLKQRSAFTAFGWARLIAQGRQWTAKTSSSRAKYKTGFTKGKGDFIEMAFQKEGLRAAAIYKKIRIPEIYKAYNKAVNKHMKSI